MELHAPIGEEDKFWKACDSKSRLVRIQIMIGREMGRISRAHFNVIPFHLETCQLGECSELLQASFSLSLVLEVRVFVTRNWP